MSLQGAEELAERCARLLSNAPVDEVPAGSDRHAATGCGSAAAACEKAAGAWGDDALGLPPALAALYARSNGLWLGMKYLQLSVWPLEDVSPAGTEAIFGDDEMRREWANDHSSDGDAVNGECCASEGWFAFANEDEFTYFFVCCRREAPHFGAVRVMTNNCNVERALTSAPFGEFLRELADWLEESGGYAGDGGKGDRPPVCDLSDEQLDDAEVGSFSRHMRRKQKKTKSK